MEPRWQREDWVERTDLIFIGGTNDFDIWVETQRQPDSRPFAIRLCQGEGNNKWDVLWNNSDDNLTLYFGDLGINRDQLREVQNYVKLFAPWAEPLLDYGKDKDDNESAAIRI